MQQPTSYSFSTFNTTIVAAALGAILGFGPISAASALSQPSVPAENDPAALKGQVVRIDKGSNQSDSNQQSSFSTLAQPGLGDGISLPTTSQKGEVQKIEGEKTIEPKGESEKGSLDIPAAGKRMDGKAEEAVSKAETGVDWSAWVSTLADRWYMSLKNMEFTSGRTYQTVRPTMIKFTCYRNGMIGGVVLKQTCGSLTYDQMQITALRRITPLPPFPEGSKRVTYTLCQGWAAHPRKPGEKDFKLGSYGKNFPIERVKSTHKIR